MAVGTGTMPNFFPIEGIRLGVAEAGIKTEGRKDLVLIEMASGGTCSGVFTQNVFCAAPVVICKKNLSQLDSHSLPSYLLINTGNANAGTGQQGMDDALSCCRFIATTFDVDSTQVFPFSTGVIGEKLPIDRIELGIPSVAKDLKNDNWQNAAEGILTTDTRPKGASIQIEYSGHRLTINGISKGSGMIKPNMATMLAFVGTDASISKPLLDKMVRELAELSFNRITVDGDTSTNDACMLLASGKSPAPEITEDHPDFPAFKSALQSVFIELAQAIVRDGEGATKFVTVSVEQSSDSKEALDTAYTIAHSPLIKTALFASDPNWGRILAALGRAPIEGLDLTKVDIFLGSVRIVHKGEKCSKYTEEAGQKVVDLDEISIVIQLGRGEVNETVWTTDLSHDYVTINAEYRT